MWSVKESTSDSVWPFHSVLSLIRTVHPDMNIKTTFILYNWNREVMLTSLLAQWEDHTALQNVSSSIPRYAPSTFRSYVRSKASEGTLSWRFQLQLIFGISVLSNVLASSELADALCLNKRYRHIYLNDVLRYCHLMKKITIDGSSGTISP